MGEFSPLPAQLLSASYFFGIHVVKDEALLCQLFIFRVWPSIVAVGVYAYATTRCKLTPNFNISWVHKLYKVLHDDIYAILMVVAVVAEAKHVKLKALTFNHVNVWNVANIYGCKVGLPGNGAKARKFWYVEFYPIVILWMLVGEGL